MSTYPNNAKDAIIGGRFSDNPFEASTFDNNSTYKYVSIYRAFTDYEMFSGQGIKDEDHALQVMLNCLRLISNVHTTAYGFLGTTDDNGELCLPTLAMQVDYVTNGAQDRTTWSIRNQISQLYPPGAYVAYKFLGDKIVTDFKNTDLSVLYKTYKQDADGLPMITEKESEACARYYEWIETTIRVKRGEALAANVLPLLTQAKNKAINQARNPERLSQNFMDQYLNIIYSQDGKNYNTSYKAVRIS